VTRRRLGASVALVVWAAAVLALWAWAPVRTTGDDEGLPQPSCELPVVSGGVVGCLRR
jgi:hypothetical protein